MIFSINRRTGFVSVLIFLGLIIPTHAAAFSLGIRPAAGVELVKIPSTILVDAQDPASVLSDPDKKTVDRAFIFYGGDLILTPLELRALSLSAVMGFRAMSSSTTGDVKDAISLSYLPLGLSVDFALKKLRASGYFSYDLGLGKKFILTVAQLANELDLKMKGLSRLRFGASAEFFLRKSLSVFAMGDYATGSFETTGGTLSILDAKSDTEVAVNVLGAKSKLSAVTFGLGVAYYFSVPASQLALEPKKLPAKKSLKKPTGKKSTGKMPVNKSKPKAGPKVTP